MRLSKSNHHLCGCYFTSDEDVQSKHYFPQVNLTAHTTILSTASRTVLCQTFRNSTNNIKECRYDFPLYDGVSVVGFTCYFGHRIIKGVVKEKNKAREVYDEAVSRGETAGLLAQGPTSDVFSTTLGNIPAGEKILVEITYIAELKNDMGANGTRFTLPNSISPRYGNVSLGRNRYDSFPATETGGISVVVDVSMAKGSFIKELRSPSHPIGVTIGNTSTAPTESPLLSQASATLALESAQLDRDFVLEIVHSEAATPRALLETHPTIPGQRALMMTLVPNFTVQPSRPEIIFVADRSASMVSKMPSLIAAIKVFLKSLPVGLLFNICSFGSKNSFLWPRSRAYSEDSLAKAIEHVGNFDADYGGTEILKAVRATIESRAKDQDLSVILCTDGDIWQQQELFSYLNEQVSKSKMSLRVFTLGIGDSVSHALIEGVARAGNGFSQAVGEQEKLDGKVVRMLAGALSPVVTDYALEVKYDAIEDDDEEYVLVETVTDSLHVMVINDSRAQDLGDDKALVVQSSDDDSQDRYDHLPVIAIPKLLQTPHNIPPLYPFSRTTAYLLMSPQASQSTPKAVILRGTSPHGPVELEIPVEVVPRPADTIHQLAARNAVGELEEGRGWIYYATDEDGLLVKNRFSKDFDQMAECEAVRLGVQYQVGGKWCSFVAVEGTTMSVQPSNKTQPSVVSPQPLLSRGPGFPMSFNSPTSPISPFNMNATPSVVNPQSTALNQISQRRALQYRSPPLSFFSAAPRKSTGGKAPRKQLASRAASVFTSAFRTASSSPSQKRKSIAGSQRLAYIKGEVDDESHDDAADISPQDTNPLHHIISLQSFDGSWPLAPLLKLLDLSNNPAPTGPRATRARGPQAENIWATVLAIKYLEIKLAYEKEAWELLANKAKGWLDGACGGDAGSRAEFEEMAEELIAGM